MSAVATPAYCATVESSICDLAVISVKYGSQAIGFTRTLCRRGVATISDRTSHRAMWPRVSFGR